jgi:hypothetical protein
MLIDITDLLDGIKNGEGVNVSQIGLALKARIAEEDEHGFYMHNGKKEPGKLIDINVETIHDRVERSVLNSSVVNSKDKELIEHLLFRYNDANINHGKEIYPYYEEFIRYYDTLDRNRVK